MSRTDEQTTAFSGSPRPEKRPAVLLYAFRPMFLAARSWAVIALILWLAMFFGYLRLPTRFDPLSWHIHEMLFGFVMAAVAGFLLTAIPNWTGRLPVRGKGLAVLAGLWLLGRLACVISADIPAWLAVIPDLSFPTTLLAVAAREILIGKNWRNLPMMAPLAVFIIADLLMHMESLNVDVPTGLGWRLGIGAPVILISVIGGRIIPLHPQLAVQTQERAALCACQSLRRGLRRFARPCRHCLGFFSSRSHQRRAAARGGIASGCPPRALGGLC
jgi:uncharacterized protein involved in response to NO